MVQRIDDCRHRRRRARDGEQHAEAQQTTILLVRDLHDLIGDELQRLWRQEPAKGMEHVVDQRRDREVAGDRDEKQQRRKQGEKEVVGQLRCHRQAVVFPERLIRRALQDLPP